MQRRSTFALFADGANDLTAYPTLPMLPVFWRLTLWLFSNEKSLFIRERRESMSYDSQGVAYTEKGECEKAYRMFEQGSQNGDPKCRYRIAVCFYHGRFVDKDVESSSVLFSECMGSIEEIAEAGDDEACRIPGCMSAPTTSSNPSGSWLNSLKR
jgi:hypothetical protein